MQVLPSSGVFTTDGAKLFYLNSYCSIAAPFLYNIKQFHHFNVNCCFNGGDCFTETNILNFCCCSHVPFLVSTKREAENFFTPIFGNAISDIMRKKTRIWTIFKLCVRLLLLRWKDNSRLGQSFGSSF